jgi:hypothetical protein
MSQNSVTLSSKNFFVFLILCLSSFHDLLISQCASKIICSTVVAICKIRLGEQALSNHYVVFLPNLHSNQLISNAKYKYLCLHDPDNMVPTQVVVKPFNYKPIFTTFHCE